MYMDTTRKITIKDILSEKQIAIAWEKWQKLLDYQISHYQFHLFLRTKLIIPNLPEINQRLGQENDPSYLAYVVEYVFISADTDHSG